MSRTENRKSQSGYKPARSLLWAAMILMALLPISICLVCGTSATALSWSGWARAVLIVELILTMVASLSCFVVGWILNVRHPGTGRGRHVQGVGGALGMVLFAGVLAFDLLSRVL